MEPIMREKRGSADLIPYRKEGDTWMFYLQKRDMQAPRAPGMISLFGGGTEGDEAPEATLARELMEELNYVTQNARYFSRYETARAIPHVFIEEVGADFESKVTVMEGESGVFLSAAEIRERPEVTAFAKKVIADLTEFLTK
jgi:8-oxo-dGTP pyrophosphatase MutT (NUDIX family)